MNKRNYSKRFFFIGLIVIYGFFCWYLYYNQLLYPVTLKFEADTPVHVSMAVEDGFYYSVTGLLYIILCKLPFENFTISFLLAFMTAFSVYLTWLLIKKVSEFEKEEIYPYSYAMAFGANLLMAFYLPFINKQHYIGYQCANMWHNSTYTAMRFFALVTLIVFIDIYKDYKEKGVGIKRWLLLTLLLALSTLCKPSFLTVFAPVFALMLLCDLIKGVKFSKIFSFGSTVFLSLLALFWQSMVLFGSSSGNGYEISPFTALSERGSHPKVTLLLSIIFPLMVLFLHIKDFYKDKLYFGSILIWLVGFLEVFFLNETGERSGDSNFFWGYSIALFIWFLMSIVRLIKDFTLGELTKIKKVWGFLCLISFLWHLLSGIWYFSLLLTGVTYFV